MMDCKLKGCERVATVRVLTPYGAANMCARCGAELERGQAVFRGLRDAFRFGPAADPPLEGERDESYPHAGPRHRELAAAAVRVQYRPGGLIVDYFGAGETLLEKYGEELVRVNLWNPNARVAVVRCVHGNEWPEGGDASTGTCAECIERSRAEVAA